MKEESIVNTYEPFGEEWEKEVSKLPKAYLIEQWKQSCLKRQQLEEFIKKLILDPYPEDVFLPISKEELLLIHQMLEAKFNMPLDRLSGHIGRLLRNPLREKAKKLLNNK